MLLPKPSQVKRPRRKASSRDLKSFYAFVAGQPCCAPGCTEPAEVAHVQAVLSRKTGLPLPRRRDAAAWACVSACASHHRGHDSIHQLGERGFEAAMGWPEGHLVRLALTNLAEWVGT